MWKINTKSITKLKSALLKKRGGMICSWCDTCAIKDTCSRLHGKTRFLEAFCKYGGTVLFFVWSLLFATTLWAGNTPVVFGMFFVWHLSWAIVGYLMGEESIVILNSMYVFFDASAMYIRI